MPLKVLKYLVNLIGFWSKVLSWIDIYILRYLYIPLLDVHE